MLPTDHIAHYRIDAEQFDYFEEPVGADRDATVRIREAVLHAARIRPRTPNSGFRICDAGSGNGWLTEAVRGCSVVSVDLGIRNLRNLRSRHPGALAVCADLTRLPFRDGSFVHVISSEVLEHIPVPELAVREFSRCLTSNGRLTVSTPYRERLRFSLCIHCNRPTPANAHLHSFDETSHRSLFRLAGLMDVHVSVIQNKLFIASRLSWLLRSLPYRIWRAVDRMCMFVLNRANTIVVSGTRNDAPSL